MQRCSKELMYDQRFATHAEARLVIFEWIEVWYQRTRIHASLSYISPEAFGAAARAGPGLRCVSTIRVQVHNHVPSISIDFTCGSICEIGLPNASLG